MAFNVEREEFSHSSVGSIRTKNGDGIEHCYCVSDEEGEGIPWNTTLLVYPIALQ